MEPAPFARVLSPEDDVRVLESLADNGEYTDPQASEKVRQLKEWYFANRRADGVVGGDATEARKYELAAKIWGGEEEHASRPAAQPKQVGKKRRRDERRRSFEEMQDLYPNLSWAVEKIASKSNCPMVAAAHKRSYGLMGDKKAAELEAKVKEQRIKEAKLACHAAKLTIEVHELYIEAMESSD